MIRYGPTDSMEEVRHGSYVLFEEANERITELKDGLMIIHNILAMEDEVYYESLIRLAYRLSEGGVDECPACKGNDKNSRLVMDATLGMDYECSDDWHKLEGDADE